MSLYKTPRLALNVDLRFFLPHGGTFYVSFLSFIPMLGPQGYDFWLVLCILFIV